MKIKRDHPVGGTKMIYSTGHNGPVMLKKRKGSNPEKEKLPAIKCPICKKFLYSVPDKNTRNLMLVYDLRDEKYSSFLPDYTHRCPRCHTMLGTLYLLPTIRKQLGNPPVKDCHGRDIIDHLNLSSD